MKIDITKVLSVILAALIPFLILMGAIRLLFTPSFPTFEYNRPGFPADPFGFSTSDREKWVTFAIDYLNNDQGIEYLGNLQDQNGLKIFTPNELQHMVDVKNVYRTALLVWYGVIGFTIAALAWFFGSKNWNQLRKAINTGAWLTIGLMAAILIYLAINFNQLFEQFHQLFFAQGTWLFSETDTLIRLLPLEFWRDGFIIASVLTLLVAALLVLITRKRSFHKPTVTTAANGKPA